MDRVGAVTWSERARDRRGANDEFVLPSRGDAVSALASALDAGRGLVLLTGEPAVGKSWVCRRLRDRMPSAWRWAAVDLTPAVAEGELFKLILHSVGFDIAASQTATRAALADVLTDAAEDGQRWGLIVDEGHNASVGVLEELRVLGNRMGEPGSFAGLVLVGQSLLARRLATRPLAAIQARISAWVHLRPLDIEELHDWLVAIEPGRVWDGDLVERVHRETGGNPRRVLARAVCRVAAAAESPEPGPRRISGAPSATETSPTLSSSWDTPPLAAGKPPIHMGDGIIEVGWEPPARSQRPPEMDSTRGTLARDEAPRVVVDAATTSPPAPAGTAGSEEVIDDHYAALQAWTEWAQNQGRRPVAEPPGGSQAESAGDSWGEPLTDLDPDEIPAARLSGHPSVRVEGQQEFAPYSQLFSRLRQARDSQ